MESKRLIKTFRIRELENEKERLLKQLEEAQAHMRQLKQGTRETQARLRQLNGELVIASIKQPTLRIVYDRDALASPTS